MKSKIYSVSLPEDLAKRFDKSDLSMSRFVQRKVREELDQADRARAQYRPPVSPFMEKAEDVKSILDSLGID